MTREISPIDVHNHQAIKRALDEEVCHFFTEKAGYKEDHLIFAIKMLLSVVAVVSAVYSHFNPTPFPQNKPMTAACLVVFLVCTILIQAMAFFIGKGCVVRTKSRQIWVPEQIRKLGKMVPGIDVCTTLPDLDDNFTVEIVPRAAHRSEKTFKAQKTTFSVFSVFDTSGKLLQAPLEEKLSALLSCYHDSASKKEN